MPAPTEELHAFDLKFFKALVNFKINGSYTSELHIAQKENLCIKFNKDGGIVQINPDYFNKIWLKGKELPNSVTLKTLNELCRILNKNYSWYLFTHDISKFRPSEIPFDVPYSLLNDHQQGLINKAIEQIFILYESYEELEQDVIKKKGIKGEKENEVIPIPINQDKEERQKIIDCMNRIYIELTTRKAAMQIDENNDVIEEIYNSWYKLFCIIRDELKSLSASYFRERNGFTILVISTKEILNEVLRPHLTEHQAKFRNWFQLVKREPRYKKITPQELQKKYPHYKILVTSMREVNSKLIVFSELLHTSVNKN